MPSLPANKPAPAVKDKVQEQAVLPSSEPVETVKSEELPLEAPSRENELAALVKAMQARLDQLEGRADEAYGDDDRLFIAKAGGENWSERRLDVGSKSYVDVEMRATGFYGPFATPEAVSAYLTAKRAKREDSFVEWENTRTVTGREKRTIEAKERAERESQGAAARLPGYFASGR